MFLYKVFIGVLLILSSPIFGSDKRAGVGDSAPSVSDFDRFACLCGQLVTAEEIRRAEHDPIFCSDRLNFITAIEVSLLVPGSAAAIDRATEISTERNDRKAATLRRLNN